MEWYEAEVRALEQKVLNRRDGDYPPAVFYGSSSFTLWSTLAGDFDPHVLNLGFGGSTLEACDYFFARLVTPAHPRSLLVYAGDNDLGDGRTVDQTVGFFRALAAKVAALPHPIPFGFISVKPSPARVGLLDKIRRLNDIVRAEIAARPSGYFVDVFSSMVDAAGNPRPEFFGPDGLHLNHDGYRLWARILQQYRDRILIG